MGIIQNEDATQNKQNEKTKSQEIERREQRERDAFCSWDEKETDPVEKRKVEKTSNPEKKIGISFNKFGENLIDRDECSPLILDHQLQEWKWE